MSSYDGTLNFDTKIDTSGFSSGISTISSVAKTGIKTTAAIITAAATGIVAFGKSAVEAGANFDSAMSQLAATMGTTTDQIGDLEQKAKDLGKSTSFSATEAAEGLNILAQAGLSTEQQLAAIDSVLNLAAAGATSMDNAASYCVTTLKGFNMEMSEAEYVSNLLAKGATLVNTDVNGLGDALSGASATANAYGQSIETTTTALLALADGGITGSQSTTYLARVMTSLYAPTSSASDALDALGVSCYDESGNARDLMDVIEDLQNATSGLTEEEKNAYMSTILGSVGLKAYNVIANKSADDIDELTASLTDCEGAAAAMAATQLDNLNGDITIMKSALEGLQIAFSDEVTPALRGLVQVGTEQLGILTDAIGENGLQGGVEACGTVLTNMVGYIAELAPSIIEAASNLIHNFCEGLKDTDLATEAIGEVLSALISAILECAGDIWSTAMVLVTKFAEGLVASAPDLIGSAGTMVDTLVTTFQEMFPRFVEAAVQIVSQLVIGLAQGLPSLVESAVTIITTIVETIINNLPTAIDAAVEVVNSLISGLDSMMPTLLEAAVELFMAIVDAIPTIIDSLVQNLPDIITTIIEALIGSAPQILEAAITLLMAIIEAIPEIVVELASSLPDIIAAIVTGLGNAIPEVFSAAKDLLWQIITAIPDIVAGLAEAVPDIISGLVSGLVGGIGDVFDAAVNLGSGIISGIKSFFGINSPSTLMEEQGDYLVEGMINGLEALPEKAAQCLTDTAAKITQWGQEILQSAIDTASNFLQNIVTYFSQIPGEILNFITMALNNVTTWAGNIAESAKTAASNVLTNITTYFSQLPGKILTNITTALNSIKTWASNIVSSAKTAASNVLSNVATYFTQLPGKIGTQLTNAISKVTSFATNLVSKMKTAATNAVSNMITQISQLPSKIWNKLTDVASKVTSFGSNLVTNFTNIGKNVISGLINGITGMVSNLYSSIKNALSGLVSKAKSALGIGSPSKVFAEEVGEWIPPGIGEGVEDAMPNLNKDIQGQLDDLSNKMTVTVAAETAKVEVDKTVNATYKAQRESGTSFDKTRTNVDISGNIYTTVELDGEKLGEVQTPIVDKNLGRIDMHKKRGG